MFSYSVQRRYEIVVCISCVTGLTPLHIAVMSHNAVVQDLSRLASPQSPQSSALMLRRKMLGECINALLQMGASYGTKVNQQTPGVAPCCWYLSLIVVSMATGP